MHSLLFGLSINSDSEIQHFRGWHVPEVNRSVNFLFWDFFLHRIFDIGYISPSRMCSPYDWWDDSPRGRLNTKWWHRLASLRLRARVACARPPRQAFLNAFWLATSESAKFGLLRTSSTDLRLRHLRSYAKPVATAKIPRKFFLRATQQRVTDDRTSTKTN